MHHRALSAPHLSGLELALNLFSQLLKAESCQLTALSSQQLASYDMTCTVRSTGATCSAFAGADGKLVHNSKRTSRRSAWAW
jgi:hypothetical protein